MNEQCKIFIELDVLIYNYHRDYGNKPKYILINRDQYIRLLYMFNIFTKRSIGHDNYKEVTELSVYREIPLIVSDMVASNINFNEKQYKDITKPIFSTKFEGLRDDII
jgi:hypothetical protein